MTLPIYLTGTVSVTHLGTTVTGAGVMWSGINVREGDYFVRADGTAVITEVTDAATLQITPWPGATVAGGNYAIEQNYVGRVVGVAAAEDVGVMLEKLHTDGLPFIVGSTETVPDPSYGDDGQLAFQPTTGLWWVKSGGVWVPSAGLVSLGYGGTSTTSLAIGLGAKVFTTQTELAYNGARVRAASAANINNWMEGVATYSGTTLTMTADLVGGAGTHADWLFAVAGQQGIQGNQGPIGPAGGAMPDAPVSVTTAYARKNAAWFGIDGAPLPANCDFNTVVAGGRYFTIDAGSTNAPAGGSGWWLAVEAYTDSVNYCRQISTAIGSGTTIYTRTKQAAVWGPWHRVAFADLNLSDITNIVTARQNLYAAPFDAMAYNGMQINGNCELSQEFVSTSVALVSATEKWVMDSWTVKFATTTGVAIAAVQDNAGVFGGGYNNTLRLNCTAGGAMGANDYVFIGHLIEGYRVAKLGWGTSNAQPITIGFLIYSNVTGFATVAARNFDLSRTYSVDVPVLAGGSKYVTVTIPGDTAGTWQKSALTGLRINIVLGCGSSDAAAANVWSGTTSKSGGTVNTSNNFATTANVIWLSGLTVHAGSEGPGQARAPLIMRPYGDELKLAMRQWEKSYDPVYTPGQSSTAVGDEAFFVGISGTINGFGFSSRFKVQKRATPTIMIYSPTSGAAGKFMDYGITNGDVNASADHIGLNGFRAYNNGLTPQTVVALAAHWTANARLTM